VVSSTDSGGVRCRVEQCSTAPPDVVYDVLLDLAHWSDWAPLVTDVSWDRPGEPETGLGGVRRVTSGGEVFRDRITASARPWQHAYVTAVPEFWPYTNLNSDVRIHDRLGGSTIVWSATCVARHPVLATSIEAKISFAHARWCAALAEEAERRARLTRRDTAGPAVGQIA
jgi:hypothetical protein